MKSRKLNTLEKKANKINNEKQHIAANKKLTLNNKNMHFNNFKVYYGLLDERNDGWGMVDLIGLSIFSLSAVLAIIIKQESIGFLWFKIISIIGALFFIFKTFLFKPILHILKYPFYSNWIKNSSFKILGWNQVFNNDEILIKTNWYQQCTVFINLTKNCSEATKNYINTASIVFIDNANWVQNNFDGTIANWTFDNGKLTGSANISTLGFIHRFINCDLNYINKTLGGIDFIEVNTDEKLIYISRNETSTSGM